MRAIQTNLASQQLKELHGPVFEALGFKLEKVNPDLDYFSVQVVRSTGQTNALSLPRLETLLMASLELFDQLLFDTQKPCRADYYFLNLHPNPIHSTTLFVEIDFLETTADVVYLEGYCYDDNELLIAKCGRSLIKDV